MPETVLREATCIDDSLNQDAMKREQEWRQTERPIIRWRNPENGEVRQFKGKLYEDIEFKPLHLTMIEDVTLKGKWDMELVDDSDNIFILRLVHRVSGDSLVLTFPSQSDRKKFAEAIVSLGDVQQVTPGMDLEGLVRKPRASRNRHGVMGYAVAAAAVAGLAVAAAKVLKRRKPLSSSLGEALEPSRI